MTDGYYPGAGMDELMRLMKAKGSVDMRDYIKEKIISLKLRPAIFKGEILEGYFLDPDGHPHSTKRRGVNPLSPCVAGKSPYPGIMVSFHGKMKRIVVHRLVAGTFHKKPTPPGVSLKEWKNTPESIKILLEEIWEVNHKDEDPENYHPDNLEWVISSHNRAAFHNHANRKKFGRYYSTPVNGYA